MLEDRDLDSETPEASSADSDAEPNEGPLDGDAFGEQQDTPILADEPGDLGSEDEPDVSDEPPADEPDGGEGQDASEDESASSEYVGISDPGQGAVDAFFGPPRLDRPRLPRPPLIPRWIWIAAASLVAIVFVALGMAWWSSTQATIATPKLTGVDVATATTRLAEQGLKISVSDKHFSPSKAGTVLSQVPAVGTKLRNGDTVTVVVSAGTEQFSMPDVVGDGMLLAQGILATKGLDVRVERAPSQQPSDTVLASNPAPGQVIHTGDIVLLTVATAGPSTDILLPYDMSGVTVLIDPAPVNDALTDVPLDVARRLRSLLEASHGKVVTTRALADPSALAEPSARAQKAAATTATVAVGLSVQPVGGAGLVVFTPSPILAHASASAKLASVVASDLALGGQTVRSATSTTDTVLAAGHSPWTRIQLGSLSQREDVAKFSDPAWEDTVARGLYKAIAAVYGRKTATPVGAG